MRTALLLLLVTPFVRADDKPIPVPDSDLAILLDQKHPKYKDTLAKYDGKIVRLSGRVRWGTPNREFPAGPDAKGFGLLTPSFKVRDRAVSVKLTLPDSKEGDDLRVRIKDAKPPGLNLTVVGRVKLGRATDGENREYQFFTGLTDVRENPAR